MWLGADNGVIPANENSAEARALFITNYKLDVMTAFARKCIFKDLHRIHTIDKGSSSTFYYTGIACAHYHEKGKMILGTNNPPISKTVINVDGLLLADIMIDDLEDAMMHLDVRSEFSHQQGVALANAFDERIARLFYLSARSAPKNKDHPGGSVITAQNALTNGSVLADCIFAAAQTLDEKDVPDDQRFIVVKPAQYYLLCKVKDLINRDYGGAGSIKDVQLQSIANMTLYKSMNLPNGQNITTPIAGEHNDYTGDFTKSVAIVGNRNAVGTVKLKDLTTRMSGSEVKTLFEATLITASYAMGHGILDPRCAIEIASDGASATPTVTPSTKP